MTSMRIWSRSQSEVALEELERKVDLLTAIQTRNGEHVRAGNDEDIRTLQKADEQNRQSKDACHPCR